MRWLFLVLAATSFGQLVPEAYYRLPVGDQVAVDLQGYVTFGFLEDLQLPETVPSAPTMTPPSLIQRAEGLYSREALAAGIEGQVELSFDVGIDGLPHNAKVVHGLGYGLDEQALDAISYWRFHPGTKDGQPVISPVIVQMSFQLPKSAHPKLERAIGAASEVAIGLYLTNACPQIRRKPVLWWTEAITRRGKLATHWACSSGTFTSTPGTADQVALTVYPSPCYRGGLLPPRCTRPVLARPTS